MSLQEIDRCLSEEIVYLSEVSTTHPHVGSIYGEEKVVTCCCYGNLLHCICTTQDYELTCQQVILAKEKLNKLLNTFKQSAINKR